MQSQKIVLAALGALAFQSAGANSFTVSEAWVRTTAPEQVVASAYMDITARESARLMGVRSPVSPNVKLHLMQMDGDMMRMREVPSLALPKNSAVSLKPGGYHLMLMKLKKPIVAGDKIPLTLIVETRGKREMILVEAIARSSMANAANAASAASADHAHMHH